MPAGCPRARNQPTFPGCRIAIKPIGLFVMEDQGKDDHKVLGVPAGDPVWRDDVPAHMLSESEHFFTIYEDLEDKKTAIEGWRDADEAHATIERSRKADTDPD